MKINGKQFKLDPRKGKIVISKPIIYKYNKLCPNDDTETNTNTTKELIKCNSSNVQGYLRLNLFALELNRYYNKVKSKFSILIGPYIVLILNMTVQSGENTYCKGPQEQKEEYNETPFSWNSIRDYVKGTVCNIKKHIMCIIQKKTGDDCEHSWIILLGLVAAFMTVIGIIIIILHECGMCPCLSSIAKKKKEENFYREQIVLMKEQMQMQQDEFYRELLRGDSTRGEGDEESEEEEVEEEEEEEEEKGRDIDDDNEKRKDDDKEKRKDCDKEKQKDDDKEKQKDDDKEKQKDDGKEKQKDDDKEKQKDDGKEKQKDDGKEKQKDDDKEKQKDDDKEKQKDDGKEKQKDDDKEKQKDDDKEKQKASVRTCNAENGNSRNDDIQIGYHAVT